MREFDTILIRAIDKFNNENLANDSVDENTYQLAYKHINKLIDKL